MSNTDLWLFCAWTLAVAVGFYALGARIGRLEERDAQWEREQQEKSDA
jgi:hypothetical protein